MEQARCAQDFYLSSVSLAQGRFLPAGLRPRSCSPLALAAGFRQENERTSLALYSAGKGSSLGWVLGQERGGEGKLSGRVGPELGMNAGRRFVPLPSPSPPSLGFRARTQEPRAFAPRPMVLRPPRSTDCSSISSSLEWVPDGALPEAPHS